MKKTIDGKMYDTDTARLVGAFTDGERERSSDYIIEALYCKRNGEYFLFDEGGMDTVYSKYDSRLGCDVAGADIHPLSFKAARMWAEEFLTRSEYEAEFGSVYYGLDSNRAYSYYRCLRKNYAANHRHDVIDR